MSTTDADAFVFGPFRLLPARRELLAHGVPVMLGQRAFDLLLALVGRHGQLVTKDELMAEVWPGVIVEENNLQVQVSALRKVLAMDADGQRYLLTVSGRGYRFVAPVLRESASSGDAHAEAKSHDTPSAGSAVAAATTNLPPQLTSFIGREADVEVVRTRLRSDRVVTLTGAGGVGKTRLAIETAIDVAANYPDGAWLVELAPLGDPQLVAPAVASALGIGLTDRGAPLDEIAAALKTRHLLLVIDNCEHLIGETARVVAAIIRACPSLHILATSRERLALAGESIFRVPSLSAPDSDAALTGGQAREFAAVRLFLDRAAALGSEVSLTDVNAAAVGAICKRLDGIPLAIELAVPRLKVLPVQRLAQGLDERFRLLTGGSRTALPRHQTLHATIDWSYDLLNAQERLLLQRLSVFAGGATLDSVAAVAAGDDISPGEILDLLSSLVEKSLVQADLTGSEPRYRLLESTRHYAREKLPPAERPELRRRHAGHVVACLTDAAAAWETTATDPWIARYAPDVDDLRAALEWAFGPQGDVSLGLDLVSRSHVVWAELGLMVEHRRWVMEALRRTEPSTPAATTARLLSWQAGDVRDLEDPADYEDALRAAFLHRQLGDRFHEGQMLLRAGTVRLLPDAIEHGEKLLHEAYALVNPSGPTKTLARCLSALASARLFAGDVAAANALHGRAVDIYRALGERPASATRSGS
jgi:predicted ATPase/DNA-binding winged helix-turn-helix (wHTH) protein